MVGRGRLADRAGRVSCSSHFRGGFRPSAWISQRSPAPSRGGVGERVDPDDAVQAVEVERRGSRRAAPRPRAQPRHETKVSAPTLHRADADRARGPRDPLRRLLGQLLGARPVGHGPLESTVAGVAEKPVEDAGVEAPRPGPRAGEPDPDEHAPDTTTFAFTDVGPWVVDPASLRWLAGIDALRARTRADIPRLLARHRVPPLGRLARSVGGLGRPLVPWYLRERGTPALAGRPGVAAAAHLRTARLDLREAGPDRVGVRGPLPRRAGGRVQEAPRPGAAGAVPRHPPGSRGRPRRSRSRRSSRSFEETPLAAASIAQVHAARLRSGEEVVVKVQRPQVATLMRKDVEALAWLAPHLIGRIPVAALANPPALVELFAEQIVEELDFRLEAQNMLDLARVFAQTGQRSRWSCPGPTRRLVTRRVLVMERLEGFAFDDVAVDAAGRCRHRRGAASRAHRLPRGRHALRGLPRRPARRQPARRARRTHRAPRLRDHGPPRRAAAAGVSPAAAHRDRRGRQGSAHRAAGPGRVPGRHGPRGGVRRPRARPAGQGPHADVGDRDGGPAPGSGDRSSSATGRGHRRTSCCS